MKPYSPFKIVIFGARQMGIEIAQNLTQMEIVAFIDGDSARHGVLNIQAHSFPVLPVENIVDLDFDFVFIPSFYNLWIQKASAQLENLGVPLHKIWHKNCFHPEHIHISHFARENFIKECAQILENTPGNVAELGVFQGDTAQIINGVFQRPFYLFDTFDGFDARDCKIESQQELSQVNTQIFKETSLEMVKKQMPHLKRCHFVPGFFPESAQHLPDLNFAFVNIDADLYAPILAGLNYFYPRLHRGGMVLIHDYFNAFYPGAQKAVDEFCLKNQLFCNPIGDSYSVFIRKI